MNFVLALCVLFCSLAFIGSTKQVWSYIFPSSRATSVDALFHWLVLSRSFDEAMFSSFGARILLKRSEPLREANLLEKRTS